MISLTLNGSVRRPAQGGSWVPSESIESASAPLPTALVVAADSADLDPIFEIPDESDPINGTVFSVLGGRFTRARVPSSRAGPTTNAHPSAPEKIGGRASTPPPTALVGAADSADLEA